MAEALGWHSEAVDEATGWIQPDIWQSTGPSEHRYMIEVTTQAVHARRREDEAANRDPADAVNRDDAGDAEDAGDAAEPNGDDGITLPTVNGGPMDSAGGDPPAVNQEGVGGDHPLSIVNEDDAAPMDSGDAAGGDPPAANQEGLVEIIRCQS